MRTIHFIAIVVGGVAILLWQSQLVFASNPYISNVSIVDIAGQAYFKYFFIEKPPSCDGIWSPELWASFNATTSGYPLTCESGRVWKNTNATNTNGYPFGTVNGGFTYYADCYEGGLYDNFLLTVDALCSQTIGNYYTLLINKVCANKNDCIAGGSLAEIQNFIYQKGGRPLENFRLFFAPDGLNSGANAGIVILVDTEIYLIDMSAVYPTYPDGQGFTSSTINFLGSYTNSLFYDQIQFLLNNTTTNSTLIYFYPLPTSEKGTFDYVYPITLFNGNWQYQARLFNSINSTYSGYSNIFNFVINITTTPAYVPPLLCDLNCYRQKLPDIFENETTTPTKIWTSATNLITTIFAPIVQWASLVRDKYDVETAKAVASTTAGKFNNLIAYSYAITGMFGGENPILYIVKMVFYIIVALIILRIILKIFKR